VAGALVVVGEAALGGADPVLSSFDREHLRVGGLHGGGAKVVDRRRVAVDHLQQLQHRLVVLQLVGEQHLVDKATAQQWIAGVGTYVDLLQHLKGALAHFGEVGAQLGVAQDRQLTSGLARILDRVVEAAELTVQRLTAADRLHQPKLLEVGDVAEVPGQRAEQRRVDVVELLVVERLDQLQRACAGLGETLRDRTLEARRHLGGDSKTLQRRDYRSVNSPEGEYSRTASTFRSRR
jgi:hypothetical protein